MRHYLDHAAATPLRPVAREAWFEASAQVGNPSSLHGAGRRARSFVEEARERIAAALGAHPTEVIFTSGGTEANNLGIVGGFRALHDADSGRDVVITSAVEHHAALDSARALAAREAARVVELPVDEHAVVSSAALEEALARADSHAALVSLQWVNNEVGAVQPIDELARRASAHEAAVHVDAVQGIGHLAFHFGSLGITTAAVSGHKVGGPVGIGVLLARRDAALAPIVHGGGQERRVRSGTLDAASAWALAAALDEAVGALAPERDRLIALGERLASSLARAVPGVIVHGPGEGRAPHVVHVIVPGAPGEALLTALDLAGVEASPGAACTAGVIEPSHVVVAMGYDGDLAWQTVRFSLGWSTTDADVEAAISAWPRAVAAARATRG